MKKSALAISLIFIFSASPSFADKWLGLRLSTNSRISSGGIKRVDGLVSSKDIQDYSNNQSNIILSAPMQALADGNFVFLKRNGYEFRHINDNGFEKFELVIKTVAKKADADNGFAKTNRQKEVKMDSEDKEYIYDDTDQLVITTRNYSYLKDLMTKLSTPSEFVSCRIEKGEVITVLQGDTSREIMHIEKVSCY